MTTVETAKDADVNNQPTSAPRKLIIAIDGPSGAGKSTLGKMLARRLGLLYLDTGAMYRAAALKVLIEGADVADAKRVNQICATARVELVNRDGAMRVLLDGRDVTDEIRSEQVSRAASVISAYSDVRRRMVALQRELAQTSGAVLDGRDIGTVVFPEADAKFFLTATPHTRAERRLEQDAKRGLATEYETILNDINQRDERDSTRSDSPLKIADDATVIDSSEIPVDDVIEKMLSAIDEARHLKQKSNDIDKANAK